NLYARIPSLVRRAGLLAAVALASACNTAPPESVVRRPQQVDSDPSNTPTRPTVDPSLRASAPMVGMFEPAAPAPYVAKVKDLLVGQPPTDDEVRAVTLDPQALRGLIDRWMGMPEYRAKMMLFFRNAFQQGQIANVDLADQLPSTIRANGTVATRMMRAIQESFARTVLQLIDEVRPLNEEVTTRRFMLNQPLSS